MDKKPPINYGFLKYAVVVPGENFFLLGQIPKGTKFPPVQKIQKKKKKNP